MGLKVLLSKTAIILILFIGFIFTPNTYSKESLKKGTIAFDYETPSKSEIEFLSKFKFIVTGEMLQKKKINLLKKNGAKLAYYEWLPADYFCSNDNDSWHKLVLEHLDSWVIDSNKDDPDPMGKKYECRDYFFSFSDDFIDARVQYLIDNVKKNGYDGLFFDWATGFNEFNDREYRFLIGEFNQKFPYLDYDAQVKKFLKKLKDSGMFIVLNRGFHSINAALDKYADFDVAESVFTTDDEEISKKIFVDNVELIEAFETNYETIDNALYYGEQFLGLAKSANSNIKFLFLNYAHPYYMKTGKTIFFKDKTYNIYKKEVDRQAIFYSEALSYLLGGINFTVGSGVGLNYVKDDVYFYDLGEPLGDYETIKTNTTNAYIRYFKKGIVIVGENSSLISIDAKHHSCMYDHYNKRYVASQNGNFKIKLISKKYFNNKTQPIGRIFTYYN
jgi:hypothetical protein